VSLFWAIINETFNLPTHFPSLPSLPLVLSKGSFCKKGKGENDNNINKGKIGWYFLFGQSVRNGRTSIGGGRGGEG